VMEEEDQHQGEIRHVVSYAMMLEMMVFLEEGYDSGDEDGNPQEEEDEQALEFVGRAQLAMILYVSFVARFRLGLCEVHDRLNPHVLALLSPSPFHSKRPGGGRFGVWTERLLRGNPEQPFLVIPGGCVFQFQRLLKKSL
jgi:hypothetical protein